MKHYLKHGFGYWVVWMLIGNACQNNANTAANKKYQDSIASCHNNIPSRFGNVTTDSTGNLSSGTTLKDHTGMVLIKGGDFLMGAADKEGRKDEYPLHAVKVKDFWMDITEVTNREFKKFVSATGYITTAEKSIDWMDILY